MAARIPATIITGFLGAGKTSLIRHLIEHNRGRRLGFLINEFGDLGIDRELLLGCGIEGCGEGDVVELANGCLCCTVADDFLPAIEKLIDRPRPPDHILIETSGLALPKPLVRAFNWPDVRARVTVDGVIAVVDSAAVAAGRFADDPAAVLAQREADPSLDHDNPLAEVFEDQLMAADMVVLNKTDLLDDDALARIEAELAPMLRAGVHPVRSAHARIDSGVLLGIGAAAEDDLDSRPSHHDGIGGEHDHDDFESFAVTLGPVADADYLQSRLIDIVRSHDVLRIKGFLDRPGRDRREVVQGVGPRFQRYFDRDWRPGEVRKSELVVIGLRGLDRAAIERAIHDAVATVEAAE
jgi:cobalamin biosynthesis protein CobW